MFSGKPISVKTRFVRGQGALYGGTFEVCGYSGVLILKCATITGDKRGQVVRKPHYRRVKMYERVI